MVLSDHRGPVRITKDDLCTHIDEFIHKKQAAFEHFLVDKHASAGLGCHNKHHADQVGRKSGPGCIVDGKDGSVDKSIHLVVIMSRNINVIPAFFEIRFPAA